MNRCVRNQTKQSAAPKSGGSKGWVVSLVCKLSIMAILIFVAVNVRIVFNQKAEQLNREAEHVKARIHQLEREIANLRNRKAQLCEWDYISRRNARFHLGLRPAEPRQVRTIAVRNYSATMSTAPKPMVRTASIAK